MLENRMVTGYGYEEEPYTPVERDDPNDEDRAESMAEIEPIYYIPAKTLFELRDSVDRLQKILDDMGDK